ncbi:hypothetical protein MN199_05080 [Rheinheimera metallidurans]|uniref:hypothetical protein n=2 Tax=Rheinheimera TaxID=67575 RepID=UPI0014055EF0|nr:hypothetical protein [Rheinheimera sp. D18]
MGNSLKNKAQRQNNTTNYNPIAIFTLSAMHALADWDNYTEPWDMLISKTIESAL